MSDTPDLLLSLETEALIAEARRRYRRRWYARLAVGVVLVSATIAIVVLATSAQRGSKRSDGSAAVALPTGPLASLHAAGPLAVAPNGALYVADAVGAGATPGGDRVLVRVRDGRFRVVAGSGRVGFSGDGGPATRAELSRVSDLAVARDGTLYIADGGRVRAVTPAGVIRTIAGSGKPARTVPNGTPALSAPLGTTSGAPALSIALGPTGQLYISTGQQLLRLTADGRLDSIRATVTTAQGNHADRAARGRRLTDFAAIAIDAHGDVDLAGGPGGWSVWQVTPDGSAHLASGDRFAHGNGGAYATLERGPGGAVYAAAGSPGIFRVESEKLVPIAPFNRPLSRPLAGQAFLALNFAFGPSGTLYTDDEPFSLLYTDTTSAFKARQQLLSVSNGHVGVLWQAPTPSPK